MVRRKGVGYNIEAFVAIIVLFFFGITAIDSPESTDLSSFQTDIEANDLGYVMKHTGNTENFLQRGETGSIQTFADSIGGFDVSGNIRGLPLQESNIGFHVRDDDVDSFDTEPVDDTDACYNDLDEIEEFTNEDILKTEDPEEGVYLYIADADPEIVGEAEDSYDSLWVDNGTDCLFSSEDGPFFENEFFWWGDHGEGGIYYDIEDFDDNGESITLHKADQTVRFRDKAGDELSGVKTDVNFDTFTFSDYDISNYDVLVLREKEVLDDLEADGFEDDLMEFLETGSVLLLADLEESDLDNWFMSQTGMEWVDLDWLNDPEGAYFPNNRDSRILKAFYDSIESGSVSMKPGGNISSGGRKLVESSTGFYNTDAWNATNTSAVEIDENDLPGDIPESDCEDGGQNYWRGDFEFPEEEYGVYASRGNCERDIWVHGIDLEGDEDYDLVIEGDSFVVDEREYRLVSHGSDGADFAYVENERVEMVNFRDSFPDQDIHRFARAGYEEEYDEGDRKLLTAVIYFLAESDKQFGDAGSLTSTSVTGVVGEDDKLSYRLDLRWDD